MSPELGRTRGVFSRGRHETAPRTSPVLRPWQAKQLSTQGDDPCYTNGCLALAEWVLSETGEGIEPSNQQLARLRCPPGRPVVSGGCGCYQQPAPLFSCAYISTPPAHPSASYSSTETTSYWPRETRRSNRSFAARCRRVRAMLGVTPSSSPSLAASTGCPCARIASAVAVAECGASSSSAPSSSGRLAPLRSAARRSRRIRSRRAVASANRASSEVTSAVTASKSFSKRSFALIWNTRRSQQGLGRKDASDASGARTLAK